MNQEERNQRKQRMIDILKSHGIEMSVWSCGCCSSPYVSFLYNGEKIFDDEDSASFDTENTNEE
jgi:hypothetical protein